MYSAKIVLFYNEYIVFCLKKVIADILLFLSGFFIPLSAEFKFNTIMELPNDVAMLLSLVNMKLRDRYSSLDELCEDLDVDRAELEKKLNDAGYEFNVELKKFW